MATQAEDLKSSLLPIPDTKAARILPPLPYILAWSATAIFLGYFMWGASLIPPNGPLNLVQAIAALLIGNFLVGVMYFINGVPARKYGIPFAVHLRPSFGYNGSKLPALIRAVPALFWYGIQTWIGASALNVVSRELIGFDNPYIWFVVFQVVQIAISASGFETIKWFDATLAVVLGVIILYMTYNAVQLYGFKLLDTAMNIEGTWGLPFWALVTALLGIFTTLMLNIGDYVRYFPKKHSGNTFFWAQVLGIMPAAIFMCSIGMIGASATGRWDPIDVFIKATNSPVVMIIAMIFIAAAQATTNLMANVVPPALVLIDIFKIKWTTAAVITGVISLFTFPWFIVTASGFVLFTQVYSVFLGPIFGIMVVDFYFIRNKKFDIRELYNPFGSHRYHKGWNLAAVIAMIVGAGLAATNVGISWFVGVIPAAIVYYGLMKFWYMREFPQPETDVIEAPAAELAELEKGQAKPATI